MNKTLIIYFNDQSKVKSDEKASFARTIEELAKRNSIAVSNIDQFTTLMSYLPGDQEVFVFIHIMSKYLNENINDDYPGKTWAISLQNHFKNCEYAFVTSDNSKNDKEIFDGKLALNVNDLMHSLFVIRNPVLKPQTVSQILGRGEPSSSKSHDKKFDFVIINALHDDELEAVKEVFGMAMDPEVSLGGKDTYNGVLTSFPEKRVLAIFQTNKGAPDASALAVEVIKEFNPRYIFMTGVCGGDSKRKFGDVMVAKFVFNVVSGKMSDEGFLREIELVKLDENIYRKIVQAKDATIRDVRSKLASGKTYDVFRKHFPVQDVQAYIEPMACSPFVIDKVGYFDTVIKLVERKAAAVEMESYGVARGAESVNFGSTKCVIVKAVMDNTVAKNDEAKLYASFTSALFLKSLLENGVIR